MQFAKKKSAEKKKNNFLFLLLGASSTMSVLAFSVGGHSISVFDISLICVLFYLLMAKKNNSLSCSDKTEMFFVLWLVISFLSCIMGFIFFIGKTNWQLASLSYIPKIIIYLFLFFIIKVQNLKDEYIESIAYGVIIGIIINLVWAIIDTLIFYLFGFSITNQIFSQYIIDNDIRYGTLSLILNNGQIRTGGLNGDPANIGLFAPVIAAYSMKTNKKALFILSVISSVASVSLVAMVGIIVVVVVVGLSEKKSRMRTSMLAMFILGILILLFIMISDIPFVVSMRDAVIERIILKFDIAVDSYRMKYYLFFVPSIISNPLSLIIGTGFGTASYAYINAGYINSDIPYDPEITYFSYFFDCGLIGFVLFAIFSCQILRLSYMKSSKSDYQAGIYAGVLGSLIAFCGYHYILYSPVMLISICAVLDNKEDRRKG